MPALLSFTNYPYWSLFRHFNLASADTSTSHSKFGLSVSASPPFSTHILSLLTRSCVPNVQYHITFFRSTCLLIFSLIPSKTSIFMSYYYTKSYQCFKVSSNSTGTTKDHIHYAYRIPRLRTVGAKTSEPNQAKLRDYLHEVVSLRRSFAYNIFLRHDNVTSQWWH